MNSIDFMLIIAVLSLGRKISNPSLYNLIKPGWMLWGNPYFIQRSALKYKSRKKAEYHNTDYDVARPYIVNAVIAAMRKLETFVDRYENFSEDLRGDAKYFVIDEDIAKCISSMDDIKRGIISYRNFIEEYAIEVLNIDIASCFMH